jgi:uncharacterized ion transporter superfamily protein YfcC
MKNLREKFQKIKFLVPLMVGFLLSAWISNAASDSTFSAVFGMMLIAIFLAIHQWRMVYDEKYRKEKTKFFEKEKKKKWYDRRSFNMLGDAIFTVTLLSFIALIVSIYLFFSDGFSSGKWEIAYLIIAIIPALIFGCCCKFYSKISSEEKSKLR